jgi:hypothetical protein
MGVPAYYGRPALVAGDPRHTTPATVRAVVVVEYLSGLLLLLAAAVVVGVDRAGLTWPAGIDPGPRVRQAVAERGLPLAGVLAAVGFACLLLARKLRQGRRWSRAVLLALSVVSCAVTIYGLVRGEQVNILLGLTLPVLLVLALCSPSARAWFRWRA